MSTKEFEIQKIRLVHKILNEKNENVIISLGNNMRTIQREIRVEKNNRKNLVDNFMQFVDTVRKPVSNYTFNREECYE
ncbi:MAG: hypothetical protein LBV75_06305 [Paludibacter sp.]|jgi:hypothetical protein|nr:hypothetical protein [Paludibacter sp.]